MFNIPNWSQSFLGNVRVNSVMAEVLTDGNYPTDQDTVNSVMVEALADGNYPTDQDNINSVMLEVFVN